MLSASPIARFRKVEPMNDHTGHVDFGKGKRQMADFNAPVWCNSSRGRRRVRVEQCVAVFRAEDLYSDLLASDPKEVRPGRCGSVGYHLDGGVVHPANYELRPNAVWRRGRVFLFCPMCERRCTRLYIPCAGFWPFRCRQCCGLTYTSQARLNYKDSLWGRGPLARMMGTTQRLWAYETTSDLRSHRRVRSYERWTKRRPIFEALAKSSRGEEV